MQVDTFHIVYSTYLRMIFLTICTFMQGIAHYLFDPAVATHRRIEDSSINTSFYSLAGANFEEDISVESILLEVWYILLSGSVV